MIKFVDGDLLNAEESYLAQGVAEGNQEGLGTGLAYKISAKWPHVQKQFKQHARSGKFRGGNIWVCEPGNDQPGFVYLATQPDMYHATLPFLRKAIKRLVVWADKNDIDSIALPKIAAGLGKLSWSDDVKSLLVHHMESSNCNFIVYEKYSYEMIEQNRAPT